MLVVIKSDESSEKKKETTTKTVIVYTPEQIAAITPEKIEIIKTGNPVAEKVVTSDEDMNKIISFIKDIEVQEKPDENIKGWSYHIMLTSYDGNTHSVTFGCIANFNGTEYNIDNNVVNDFDKLYGSLNYEEVKPRTENFYDKLG